jgi:hypothetical protein
MTAILTLNEYMCGVGSAKDWRKNKFTFFGSLAPLWGTVSRPNLLAWTAAHKGGDYMKM